MYLHAHPHRVENHLATLGHFCLPLMCAALQGHLCLRRDLPGVMVSATNMLIVKSSQHAAIGHRRSKTYGSLGAHDFDRCGLDDGNEPRGEILSAPGLGSTTPLNTSERSRSTVLHSMNT
jgi:hypothetical protein